MVSVQVNKADVAAEFVEVVKHLDYNTARKIPVGIMYRMNKIKNPDHKVVLQKGVALENQGLMQETLDLLAAVYKKYCASESERRLIHKAGEERVAKEEAIKREKYNPDNIFETSNKETVNKETIKVEEVQTDMIVKEETFIKKIINFFKNLFGGNK